MSDQIDQLLATHERMRARINRQQAVLDARCAELRTALDQCLGEQKNLAQRLWALEETERAYREYLPEDETSRDTQPPMEGAPKKLRARIGPQRYLMLAALRSAPCLTPEAIAVLTGIEVRQIKAQLGSDTEIGVVSLEPYGFALTPEGTDLMARYEEYKQSRGEPLPSRADAAGEAAEVTEDSNEDDDDRALAALLE